jgi:cytochrome c-type biogenesis protein
VRIAALALTLSALGGCAASDRDRHSAARVEVGAPVPAYRAIDLARDTVSLAALRGRVVLLNVWATWCHPCRDEIPELKAVHATYRHRGLELVGVSVDVGGAEEQIRDFMKEFDMTYPVWLDPEERVSTQFLIIGVPATFLIDKHGVLRWRKTGPVMPGDTSLTNAIERALAPAD